MPQGRLSNGPGQLFNAIAIAACTNFLRATSLGTRVFFPLLALEVLLWLDGGGTWSAAVATRRWGFLFFNHVHVCVPRCCWEWNRTVWAAVGHLRQQLAALFTRAEYLWRRAPRTADNFRPFKRSPNRTSRVGRMHRVDGSYRSTRLQCFRLQDKRVIGRLIQGAAWPGGFCCRTVGSTRPGRSAAACIGRRRLCGGTVWLAATCGFETATRTGDLAWVERQTSHVDAQRQCPCTFRGWPIGRQGRSCSTSGGTTLFDAWGWWSGWRHPCFPYSNVLMARRWVEVNLKNDGVAGMTRLFGTALLGLAAGVVIVPSECIAEVEASRGSLLVHVTRWAVQKATNQGRP